MVTAHRTTCKLRTGAPPFRVSEPTSKEIMEGIQNRLTESRLMNDEDLRAVSF